MKYIIHCYKNRLWYVNGYLIPSMIEQGISKEDIIIFNDYSKRGNLMSFLDSCEWIKDNLDLDKGCWHLQDDVIISRKFAEETKHILEDGIMCGFVSARYNNRNKEFIGKTRLENAWCSFPCIYIPNKYMGEFLEWIDKAKELENEWEYKRRYDSNRHDDFFFLHFMREKHSDCYAFHIKPNLVDHIDYLIGGSINKPRDENVTAHWFEDKDLVEELKNKLDRRC